MKTTQVEDFSHRCIFKKNCRKIVIAVAMLNEKLKRVCAITSSEEVAKFEINTL